MRIKSLLAPVLIGLLSYSAQAADWYAVTLRGSCSYLGDNDKIAKRPINNLSIIRDYIATQTEPPPEKQLKLGYNPEADTINIVDTVTGESVLEVIAFGSPTVVANSTDTQRLRHVFLFPDGQSEAKGTAQITEKITRDGENVITRLVSKGNFNFARAATGETPAEVCTGTFGVGKKIKFETPEPTP
jgi:hypothetical protein